jgi:hypothetical protein
MHIKKLIRETIMAKEEYERITELEFGYEMLTWDSKGTYPLEAVSSIAYEDDLGEFYAPAIQNYVTGETMITGDVDGYNNRESLMRCIGRCWDKAERNVTQKMKESKKEES